MNQPEISVVIPIYNEEDCLQTLFDRLLPVMDRLKRPYEVLLVNDGSADQSREIINRLHGERPDVIRAVHLLRNYGQHRAILAGFKTAQGSVIVNLDADCQNPPEEIPKLLEKYDAGYDLVSGYRENRNDHPFRKFISKLSNIAREKMMGIHTKDHGCMLMAYDRHVIDQILSCQETSTFITVLAYLFAANPIDIPVAHEARVEGISKYTPFKLIAYSLDLFTSFSLLPLKIFTFFGFCVSACSGLLVFYMLARRLFIGPEAEGVFTLFAITFFLISVVITGIGILGEYIGRIYEVVRGRPRFIIGELRGADFDGAAVRSQRQNQGSGRQTKALPQKKAAVKTPAVKTPVPKATPLKKAPALKTPAKKTAPLKTEPKGK